MAGVKDGAPPMGFRQRYVHLDLKGAPPSVEFLERLFPMLHGMGATGLLIEWEDTLPYTGRLRVVRHPTQCYSTKEVQRILDAAKRASLDVVPLVQTFGHLEFVLKHDRFASMREARDNYMDLCPLSNGAKELVLELISQVAGFHPTSRCIHIGCDEVFGFATCSKCRAYVSKPGGGEKLFMQHIMHGLCAVQKLGRVPLIWHDMVQSFSASSLDMLASTGVQIVVWRYGVEVSTESLPSMWRRLKAASIPVWGASAFKGASQPDALWVPTVHHLANHTSWLEVAQEIPMVGIFLTGWTRFNHSAALCEVLPAAIPSLALCLATLAANGWSPVIHSEVYGALGLGDFPMMPSLDELDAVPVGSFPGARLFTQLGQLERVRRIKTKLEENIRLFCPPFTRRANPPMWRRLLDQCEAIVTVLTTLTTTIQAAAKGTMNADCVGELLDTKVAALQHDAERLAQHLRRCCVSHKIGVNARGGGARGGSYTAAPKPTTELAAVAAAVDVSGRASADHEMSISPIATPGADDQVMGAPSPPAPTTVVARSVVAGSSVVAISAVASMSSAVTSVAEVPRFDTSP